MRSVPAAETRQFGYLAKSRIVFNVFTRVSWHNLRYDNDVTKAAAFFDLDKTIIATSTSAAFTKPLYDGGLVTRSDVVKTAAAHIQYLVGNADADATEKMRKQLSETATGWDVSRVKEIVNEAVTSHIDPYVYQEAVNLIAEHHELGHDVVIISASATELVEPVAKLLGADHFVGTVLTVEDGKYTGDIEFYAYGEAKAEAIRELAELYDYSLSDSYAYTDSVTDVPMLEAVGHGTVVNPDKALRVMASERGWDMARFQNPVTLRNSLAQRIANIPGHVANIPTHVSHIPTHVSHIPAHVANIPDHVASIPGRVATIPGAVKDSVKDNSKKYAAIAAGAAGAAAAGLAIARTIRRGGQNNQAKSAQPKTGQLKVVPPKLNSSKLDSPKVKAKGDNGK